MTQSLPLPGRAATDSPEKIRFAIVGCGYVADNYMFAARQYPHVELVCAFDIVPAHARRFTAQWGIPAAESRTAFFEALAQDGGCDMILNLTNPEAHYDVSAACLERGFAVYSEKPLAMRFDEVLALADLARARSLILTGAPCNHLGEAAQATRRALTQGRIGKPLLAYAEVDDTLIAAAPVGLWKNASGAPWPAEDEFRVGCTLEHAGYYLTWLVAMFGPITEVTAFAGLLHPGKPVGGDVEGPDFSVAALRFDSGFVARLTCSGIAPRDHALKVFGDAGELRAEDCWFYQTPVSYRRWIRIRRRLMLTPWINRPRLDPPPVATKKGSTVGMDFIRGPVEAIEAARTGRPSRMGLDFCIHVNEVALAIHHAIDTPGVYKVRSTCDAPGAIPSPLDAQTAPGWLDRNLPPLLARVFDNQLFNRGGAS